MNNLDNKSLLKTVNGVPIKVDKDGSLGLLALGDIGIQLWRKERLAHHNAQISNPTISSNTKSHTS